MIVVVVDGSAGGGSRALAVAGTGEDVGGGSCESLAPSLARVDRSALRDGGGARDLATFLVVARVNDVSDEVREDSVDSDDIVPYSGVSSGWMGCIGVGHSCF